jgi:tRNA(Ile)-lysidine synthase
MAPIAPAGPPNIAFVLMVAKEEALEALAAAARASGLIDPGGSAVVLVSGGADSACAAAALARLLGPEAVHGLHVNYGLRPEADRDERACRELCGRLRIDLHVERPEQLRGNLQAAAREVRYDAAERLRSRTGADLIATGHTRTDLAETVLYRLATSPGARALRAMPDRRGRLVRPLLSLSREAVRALAVAAALPFEDDPSNLDPSFARNRIRNEVMPVLAELGAAEASIAETHTELVEEGDLLDRLILAELEGAGSPPGSAQIDAAELASFRPPLRRLALRALAERAAGRTVALGRDRAAEIARVASHPEGGVVELGGGVRAICEAGAVRFEVASPADAAPEPAALMVPGICRIGRWEVRAELHPVPVEPAGPDLATLDAEALGGSLEVRTWRHGDRIRPLGMEGTKSLQDLFTDRGVPRSARRDLPVVVAGDRVAWVVGVAVSDEFKLAPSTRQVAVLTARAHDG